MSKPNFSPGPWNFERLDGDYCVRDANGRAFMCDTRYYPWNSKNIEDWHLIATAPEMYEILSRLRDGMYCVCHLNQLVAPLGAGIKCKVCAIDTLLAKARGELVTDPPHPSNVPG